MEKASIVSIESPTIRASWIPTEAGAILPSLASSACRVKVIGSVANMQNWARAGSLTLAKQVIDCI